MPSWVWSFPGGCFDVGVEGAQEQPAGDDRKDGLYVHFRPPSLLVGKRTERSYVLLNFVGKGRFLAAFPQGLALFW